jgi:hypothetical protein
MTTTTTTTTQPCVIDLQLYTSAHERVASGNGIWQWAKEARGLT